MHARLASLRDRPDRDWLGSVVLPVLIFAAARAASTALLLTQGREHPGLPMGEVPMVLGPEEGPLRLLESWDGQWYRTITEQGYPEQLPLHEDGRVRQNPWAFFPLFPALVKVLTGTGIPYAVAGSAVSLFFGALAMVLLHHMLAPATGRFTALTTVTALSFSPASLVFGAPYTESLALALILGALIALNSRRAGTFALLATVLSLARPASPALAAVSGVVWILWWRRRDAVPFPVRQRWTWAAATLWAAASSVIWPVVVAVALGDPEAYARTQRAWHPPGEDWSTWITDTATLPVALLVLALAVAVAVRYARQWPLPLRAWTVVYPLFILAVSRPTSSIIRYLTLTAATAWPVPSLSQQVRRTPSRLALLAGVALAGLLTQALWIGNFWVSPTGRLYP